MLLVLRVRRGKNLLANNCVHDHIPQTDHCIIHVISKYLAEAVVHTLLIIISRISYSEIGQC